MCWGVECVSECCVQEGRSRVCVRLSFRASKTVRARCTPARASFVKTGSSILSKLGLTVCKHTSWPLYRPFQAPMTGQTVTRANGRAPPSRWVWNARAVVKNWRCRVRVCERKHLFHALSAWAASAAFGHAPPALRGRPRRAGRTQRVPLLHGSCLRRALCIVRLCLPHHPRGREQDHTRPPED